MVIFLTRWLIIVHKECSNCIQKGSTNSYVFPDDSFAHTSAENYKQANQYADFFLSAYNSKWKRIPDLIPKKQNEQNFEVYGLLGKC